MFETFGSATPGGEAALGIGLDAMLRATALMAFVFSIHLTLGRRDAVIRSALWNACLLALLVLPLSNLCLPDLALPILRGERVGETGSPVPAPTMVSYAETRIAAPSASEAMPIAPSETDAQTAAEASPVPRSPGATDRSPALPLDRIIPIIYLTGVLLLVARLISSLVMVARLRRQSVPVEAELWTAALERWSRRLGIVRRVALRRSDRISVPVAIGWLSPMIVLPARLSQDAIGTVVDAVLLHELGHIRRGDYGWNLVRKLVQCVYWPHPLAWPLGRIIGAVREQACDDLCIHHLGGAPAYRASLLDVAAGLIRRPEPALGLAMARPTNLERRLDWIDRSRGVPHCLLRSPARFAIAVAIVTVAAMIGSVTPVEARPEQPSQAAAKPPEKTPADNTAEPPPAIEITVIGKDTGKPLANATVRASIDFGSPVFRTDDRGIIRIDLSQRQFRDTLNLDVWADGYVQQRHSYSLLDPSVPRIPARVAFALLPGEETLGGTVVDEQQRPIAGVKVEVWGYLGEKKEKSESAYMVDARTDEKGQWRCKSFRSMTFAYLYLSHPEYLADNDSHPRQHGQPRPSTPAQAGEQALSPLRDFSDVQVMTKGAAISGKVVDEIGKPVPGAEVGWFESNQNSTFHFDMPTTTTGADGGFRFPHARPGRLAIQVKARGHAPAMVSMEAGAKDATEPLAIILGPARSLIGNVVDSKGKPIADALVVVDTWRGYRSLGVYLKSDAEGRFRWDDAPPDSFLINASRLGYSHLIQRSVSPQEKELILTLRRSLSIRGAVRDADTNKGIEEARAESGIVDPNTGAVQWSAGPELYVLQGHLSANLSAEEPTEYRVRIRARGYQPFETRAIRSDERSVALDIKLTKAAPDDANTLKGTVRRPDGQPLAGAEVVLTYPIGAGHSSPSVRIENGKVQVDPGLAIAKTDANGQFSIDREPDPEGKYYAVLVVHPDAYAEVGRAAFGANPAITAKPWARIEGTIRINGRPAPRAEVNYFADRLGNSDVPYVSDGGKVTADARGRFVLERVVPGDVRVARGFGDPSSRESYRGWSNGTLVEARAGETARADVGGNGRPVIARVALAEGFDPKALDTLNSEFEIESDRPNIPYPKDVFAKGTSVDWGKTWWASAEGHDYRRNWFRLGQAKLESDGTIRADDVPPGDYVLRLRYASQASAGIFLGGADPSVSLTRRFTVPPIPGGNSFEPLDLGALTTKPEPER